MKKHITQTEIEQELHAIGRDFKADHSLKEEIKGDIMHKIVSGYLPATSNWHPKPFAFAPAILAGLVILTSATAVMADTAKPGDFLFSIDVLTEKISQRLLNDESAKAKLYASISEERVSELGEIEDERPEQSDKKWENNHSDAQERVAESLERLKQVQEVVLERYSSTENPAKKDALLKLSKTLQQVIDRRGQLPGKVREDDDNNESDESSRFNLSDETKTRIKKEVRNDFNNSGEYPKSDSDQPDNGGEGDEQTTPPSGNDDDWGEPSDPDEIKEEDPNFPGIEYGNNSLIESGVNQINTQESPLEGIENNN